jgi:hypothetical protein
VSAASDPSGAASPVETCPLCGARIAAHDVRCPECNLSLAGIGARPGPFDRRALVLWVAGLLVIYLVVLAIVLVAR